MGSEHTDSKAHNQLKSRINIPASFGRLGRPYVFTLQLRQRRKIVLVVGIGQAGALLSTGGHHAYRAAGLGLLASTDPEHDVTSYTFKGSNRLLWSPSALKIRSTQSGRLLSTPRHFLGWGCQREISAVSPRRSGIFSNIFSTHKKYITSTKHSVNVYK